MGDWLSTLTGGWFQTDGLVPGFVEVFTDGWWNAYDSSWSPGGAVEVYDLALLYYLERRRR